MSAVLGRNETLAEAAMLPHRSFNLTCILLQPLLDMFWCGLLSALLLQYWQTDARRDRPWLRLNVLAAAVLAYGYSGYCIFINVHFFVLNYGLYAPFYDYGLTAAFPALDATNSAVAHVYLTHRAYRLNPRYPVPAFMGLVVLLYLAAAYTRTALVAQHWAHAGEGWVGSTPAATIWVVGTMVANLAVAGLILLGLHRTRAAWARSGEDMPLLRPLRVLLEAQVQLAALSIIFAGVVTANPTSFATYLLQGIGSKLYPIGVVWSLYSRAYFSPPPPEDETPTEWWPSNETGATELKVKVDVETAVHTDADGHPATLPYSINRDGKGMAAGTESYPSATSESRTGSFTESVGTPPSPSSAGSVETPPSPSSAGSSPTSRRKPVPKEDDFVIV
ncbi:hypothetical protein Q8F55_007711 [Vanrija albida]|uniref:Uncharacterized protein n=1 Tax=Vanrija albida TaxID=181172 RepID=A0ABR3PUB3_9TREE